MKAGCREFDFQPGYLLDELENLIRLYAQHGVNT